jgi:LmbE family N-acetylglucosaminyl deacetylase
MSNNNNVLVVAAHPDDEVLGCWGTMASLVQEGHKVYIAILGEGATSRYQARDQADQSKVERLVSDSQKVAAMIGAKQVFNYSLPDNRFDTLPMLDVVKIIEKLVSQIEPAVIYTHHPSDLNIDHGVVFRATLTATRPLPGCPVRDLYTFEIPSSTEWSFSMYKPEFRPNVFVDITDTVDIKVEAMQTYKSESRSFPHPRSPESLRGIASRWGSVVGVEYAEAFELIRSIR